MTALGQRLRRTSIELRSTRPLQIALRAATLGSRFLLTIYLAKSLGIDELGVFGFVMGLVGVVPPVTGWGLNYFLGREVVGRSLDDAAIIVRDRLVITLLSLAAIVPFVPGITLLGTPVTPGRITLVTAIVIVETISSDLQTPLISLGMSLFANVLFFVRSSAWVFIYIGVATIAPSFRTLDTAFYLWLTSGFVQFMLLYIIVLRHIDRVKFLATHLHIRRMLSSIRDGLAVYAYDIGNAGFVYLDRYYVAVMLGVHDLGTFTLYWSLSNGVNALVASGIVQPATPELIRAYAAEAQHVWDRLFKQLVKNTILAGVMLGAATAIMAWAATSYLRLGNFQNNYPFFLLLLGAATLRSLSDALNLALASRHMDRAYSLIGISSVLIATPLNIVGVILLQLKGVAIAGCVAQAVVVLIKWYLLRISRKTVSLVMK